MKTIKNNRTVTSIALVCFASVFLTACTAYVQPIQPTPRPVPGPRFNHPWVPGHYDRFGGWVPGHYR